MQGCLLEMMSNIHMLIFFSNTYDTVKTISSEITRLVVYWARITSANVVECIFAIRGRIMFGSIRKDAFVVITLGVRTIQRQYDAGQPIDFHIALGTTHCVATCDRNFQVFAVVKELERFEKLELDGYSVSFVAEFTPETLCAHPKLEAFRLFRVTAFTAKYALPSVYAEPCLLEAIEKDAHEVA